MPKEENTEQPKMGLLNWEDFQEQLPNQQQQQQQAMPMLRRHPNALWGRIFAGNDALPANDSVSKSEDEKAFPGVRFQYAWQTKIYDDIAGALGMDRVVDLGSVSDASPILLANLKSLIDDAGSLSRTPLLSPVPKASIPEKPWEGKVAPRVFPVSRLPLRPLDIYGISSKLDPRGRNEEVSQDDEMVFGRPYTDSALSGFAPGTQHRSQGKRQVPETRLDTVDADEESRTWVASENWMLTKVSN